MRPSPQLNNAAWRKSSYSNPQGGECVEVAQGTPGLVPVRDSKDVARGVLTLHPSTWDALTTALKRA